MYKRSFGARVWTIANKYNIEQTQVHKIISNYVGYCRDLILNGNVVTIANLVTLEPDCIASDYRATLAYQCKAVAEDINLSYHTVYSIVKEYLDFLKEDILKGNSVDIRGIVSLHPVLSNDCVVKIHSAISKSIKRDLLLKNKDVTSVRAHTHKLLKHSIKLSSTYSQEVVSQ